MTPQVFDQFTDSFVAKMRDILVCKGGDYAGENDRLANFKHLAESLGLTPLQIWAVYFTKHVDALHRLARTGKLMSEPPLGRFLDVANYALLGAALHEDMKREKINDP